MRYWNLLSLCGGCTAAAEDWSWRSACPAKLLLNPASAEMLPAPLDKVLEAQLMFLDHVPESLDLLRPKVMSQAIGCSWCIWISVSPGVE
mmetsp:Transcript_35464/g.57028  ORF Transcript_35464/g.57028 Transcript_35464/m.57028 type:complete len:90 (-) Transcript_35464:325-594(-)